jgi:hypothetical protein
MSDADEAASAFTDRAKQYKEATDKVRERSDAAAKALVGLGTAGLTAVGISKFSDVYPLPDGELGTALLVGAAFLLMAGVLVTLTFLLLTANRPLVTEVDADKMSASADEKKAIKKIYDEVAKRNGAEAMRVYDARGQRFQRIADRKTTPEEATPILAKAARIRSETDAAMARAALIVSRRRMTDALKGWQAGVCALVFVVALLTFGIGADRLESKRTDEVAAYKACAEAETAGVIKLPSICNDVTMKKPDPPAEEKNRDEALAAYATCVETVIKRSLPLITCDGFKADLEAAAKKVKP